MKVLRTIAMLLLAGLAAVPANARQAADEIAELRHMLTTLQADYDARISDLEQRLARAERQAGAARRDADEAVELAEQTAIDLSSGSSSPNIYNPAIGAVVTGRYADAGSGWEEIPGFQPAGEIGTGESGFALGEAEINLSANIDARYYGNLTVAVADEDGEAAVEFEEAWVQTTDLPAGLSATGGRFFSAAGYLNGRHFHTDDFADRPLPYQAFFGGRYTVDGVRANWVAPTSTLLELGAEANWGGGFPATANAARSPGSWTLFAKLGGDIGDSQSWQLGLSHLQTDALGREAGDVAEAFSGDSDLTVVDFVWKWAPGGNPVRRSLKLQGEYFDRSETGRYAGLPYAGDQQGWYLQGVWQFAPLWRAGLRHDVVEADNGPLFAGTLLEDPGRRSHRDSVMLDWSPSEFSRLRMQYTHDKVLAAADRQWILQYIMSIGAHGAHQF